MILEVYVQVSKFKYFKEMKILLFLSESSFRPISLNKTVFLFPGRNRDEVEGYDFNFKKLTVKILSIDFFNL